ncbi:extracellular ribonuclease LE-like [Corylus avellana]|uniref:extracellular ribonuclease LE-like n=1 Tax=Corylus avellana TaxID=13451 RepID=UPI00286D15BE|nr:extracellular ribonuclease LE-like [Corylus avellana]
MKLVFACLLVCALCFQAGTLAIDFYYLTIEWPKSFCNSGARISCTNVPNHFTIHGLWQEMNNGAPIPPPPVKQPFDNVQVKSDPALYQTMQQIWPGLTVTMPNEIFWKHEWDQHGAFTSFTQHDYLKIAVDRANDLGVLQLVQELNHAAGISIGKKYTVQYFKSAIQAAVGLKLGRPLEMHIICNFDLSGQNKVAQIHEIWFCTDNTGLQFINCTSKSSIRPCGPKGVYALPLP